MFTTLLSCHLRHVDVLSSVFAVIVSAKEEEKAGMEGGGEKTDK